MRPAKNKNQIKVVSFDLDGTLVSRELEQEFWWQEIPRLYALQHRVSSAKATEVWEKEVRKVSERRAEWFEAGFWFKRLGLKEDHNRILRDLRHLIRVYPEAKGVLRKLRKAGFKLVVFSNASRDFLNLKLEVCGLEKYFDAVYSVTSDLKKTKSPNAFKILAEKMRVKPGQIIHVGDFYYEDIVTATKAGVNTVFLDRSRKRKKGIKKGKTVSNLRQFGEIVLKQNGKTK